MHNEFMEDIRFERQFRTPYSESYQIMQGNSLHSNNRVGIIDIHFTSNIVQGILILERELEEAEISNLIAQIDEDLVLSADVPRDDFHVSVFQGKDIHFFSDEYFAEADEGETDFVEGDEE